MSAIVKLDNIGVVFPPVTGSQSVHALENINLEFAEDEFVVALGASGCGKTTLLNVMAGFIPPTFGQISHMGEPIVGPGRDRGVVFQKHALFPWFNVVERNSGLNSKAWARPSGAASHASI
jgi:taurine transport system ATP-binding protein